MGVHVVPAVEVQSLCSLRPLDCEPSLCGDPTGRCIQGRMVQFQAMKPSRVEGPLDDGTQSQRRDPLPSSSGKDSVRHPRSALIQAHTAYANAPVQRVVLRDGPTATQVLLPTL